MTSTYILQEYFIFQGPPKGIQGATRLCKSLFGAKGTNNLFSIEPSNHDRPKLTKICLVSK